MALDSPSQTTYIEHEDVELLLESANTSVE